MRSRKLSLPKSEIVKKSSEITDIIKNSNQVSGKFLRIYYRFVPKGETYTRTAFAVTKKVKTAVLKNRAKRLMREVYRLNRPQLIDLLSSRNETLEFVFLFTADSETLKCLKRQDVDADFQSLLEKIFKSSE